MVPVIVAGHGIAPIGLILFLGQGEWHGPMLASWAGIVALIISCFPKSRVRATSLELVGMGLLLVGWLMFLVSNDEGSYFFTLFTSIPLAGAVAAKLYVFVWIWWKRGSSC